MYLNGHVSCVRLYYCIFFAKISNQTMSEKYIQFYVADDSLRLYHVCATTNPKECIEWYE